MASRISFRNHRAVLMGRPDESGCPAAPGERPALQGAILAEASPRDASLQAHQVVALAGWSHLETPLIDRHGKLIPFTFHVTPHAALRAHPGVGREIDSWAFCGSWASD